MTKPTREEVDQLIVEAKDWLQSRDVVVLKKLYAAYLAQGEELKLKDENLSDYKAMLETTLDQADKLQAENQALKAELNRLEA